MLHNPKWTNPEAETREPWRLVLLTAADIIDCHGLAKGTGMDKHGRRCAHRAMYDAVGCPAAGDPEYSPAYKIYWEACEKLAGYLESHGVGMRIKGSVADWNDNPLRTKQEVVYALRETALS